MNPWPGAYTYFRGKTVKLLNVSVVSTEKGASLETIKHPLVPGTVVALGDPDGPLIATGDGLIRVLEIQPQNKKPMQCSDFCRGYHLAIGDRLTE